MYDTAADVMYLTGYTAAYPPVFGFGAGVAGRAMMRINDWSGGNRAPAWTIELPMTSAATFIKSVTMAGDYLFAGESRAPNTIHVYSKATGAQVSSLLPGPEVGSTAGWLDIPYALNAYQRDNGEYLIFSEEDNFAKALLYRMNDGLPVKAITLAFSLTPGAYEGTQTLTLSSATSGTTIRYTTDGTIPTATTGTVYTSPLSLSSSATLRAIAYKSGIPDSTVASGYYTINTVVASPAFGPTPKTYSTSPMSITIGSSTSGATIRYTTDGSTPTPSTGTIYSGPVHISATTTLKAIAYRSGMASSTVSTGVFTISNAEVRLTPTGGDSFLFNGNTAEVQAKYPLPYTYNLTFDNAVELDRLVLWMPSTWGGPVNMTAEIRGGLTYSGITSIVGPTVYSISGSVPRNITIPATNLKYLQIVISTSHNNTGNLSEVEVYGHNLQLATAPVAPSALSATTASSSQINLSWTDNSSNETGFKIDRATDSGLTANLVTSTVGANVRTYQATGLTASTTYYFRVRATNTNGNSANTATASATTPVASLGIFTSASDIGSPALGGGTSESGGAYTVIGGGTDIWGVSDQFQFANKDIAGDGSIVARVDSLQNTDPWAKGGVMFRNGLAANAMFADVIVTPGNGISFQWRSTTGGSCGSLKVTGTAPKWVKLVRSGNSFTAFYGSDGINWTPIGSAQTITMARTAKVGLCVTSHNASALCTATFSNVAVQFASATPAGVSLQAASDTGTSNSDGITKLTIGLKFSVTGTVSGATINLYDGGTLIGSAIAAGTTTTTTITTNIALADGLHNAITAKQTEVGKSLSSASTATSATIDTVVPAAPVFSVNTGQSQRSKVNTLSLVFSEKVIVPTGGLLLQSHSGSPTSNINLILNNASGDGVNYTVTFSGTAIVGNSLPDGIYDLIAKAVLVQDVAGNALAADAPFVFHRLLGDANGDGKTDMADNRAFVGAIGTSKINPAYRWYFDFNNDDKIDMADNRFFVGRLGTTLNI